MVNPYAGEVALVIDGRRHVAKLTLGALAERAMTFIPANVSVQEPAKHAVS